MSSILLSIFLLSIGASFIQRTTGFGFGILIQFSTVLWHGTFPHLPSNTSPKISKIFTTVRRPQFVRVYISMQSLITRSEYRCPETASKVILSALCSRLPS